MHKHILLSAFLMVLIISCTASGKSATPTAQTIALSDCALRTPGIELQIDAECGSFSVLENPASLTSRQINLNVAVVPAIQRNPEPDPLFILVGGPGQAATEVFPALSSALFGIHENRDIVLIDQRGTGKSNPLRCIDPSDKTLSSEETTAVLRMCPGELDADLRYYTTDVAMQDLDQVRLALGYETINLYGVSYGTRAALTYLKMYPARVRSIILDAVVDPEFVLYQDVAADGQRALEFFFARCGQDEQCASNFPDLQSEFDGLLNDLKAAPANVTIPEPVTGQPLDVTITPTLFTDIVLSALYAPDLVAMLPLAIHQAYEEENFAPLITLSYITNAGLYEGMFYSVTCNEDAPFVNLPVQDQKNLASPFQHSVETFLEVCEFWPTADSPTSVHDPVSSNVPVLMFSGEADPVTPPRHADKLAQRLPNSLNLTFASMGHGNTNGRCASEILERFIESASLSDLDTSCVSTVEPPPFWVDFSGPQP